MKTLHQIEDMALEQLDTALRLYFEEEKSYYSVITLAGAAEELLGKLLKENGQKTALNITTKKGRAVSERLRGEDEAAPERWFATRANNAKNRLKHGSPNQSKSVEFDAEEEAKDMLQRAIDNYSMLTKDISKETENMSRFVRMHRSNNALPLTSYSRPIFKKNG